MVGSGFAGIKQMPINFATRAGTNKEEFKAQPIFDPDSEVCLQCHNRVI